MTNRAAIYTRVSTRSQSEDGASLDTQLEECRALAAELELEVVGEYSDVATGTARSRKVRPGYFAMMDAMRLGTADNIIAWKEDRLYRGFGVVPFYELVEDLKLTPKRVHMVHGNWDRKMMLLMAGIAQVELEDIKLRTIAGRKRSLRKGNWIFPAPFGYEVVEGKILVNAAEAAALVEMLTLYSSGIPHTAVRSHLEKEHPVTRYNKAWSVGTFHRLIRNVDNYATGRITATLDGENFTITVDPLIDRDLADRVTKRRSANRTRPVSRQLYDYMLDGLVTCTCGVIWRSKTDGREGSPRGFYRCHKLKTEKHPDCGRTIAASKIEPAVWDTVWDTFLAEADPERGIEGASHAWVKSTTEHLTANKADTEAKLADAERELRGIETKRLNLDEMLMEDLTKKRRHAQLNAGLDGAEMLQTRRLNEATDALAALRAESHFFDAATEMFVRMREGSSSQAAKREVVHALVESVLVRRVDGEPTYTLNWRVEVPATNIHVSGST